MCSPVALPLSVFSFFSPTPPPTIPPASTRQEKSQCLWKIVESYGSLLQNPAQRDFKNIQHLDHNYKTVVLSYNT